MEQIDKELSVVVVLPGGVEKMTTVHGSKPLMDLLVTLCAKYHLNPSGHTLELVTSNKNYIKLKPNALIGTLDPQKVLIKPKGEDKNKKTGPQMPEATVRMVINYKQTQKTILRVNPRVPLAQLLPAICEKCEFEEESTILLKDVTSLSPLDLSASLNDYAIREVYARDTREPSSPVSPASPSYTGLISPGKDKNQKEKENKGLFSKFRKSKKSKPEQATTASAPASPVLVSRPRPLSMALPSTNYSSYGSPGDAPKKRRAPQPPILVSQMSCPSDFSPRQRLYSEPCTRLGSTEQTPTLSRGSSTDSSLKRTKRKAPPPPTAPTVTEALSPDDLQASAPANTLEEIKEQEEVNSSAMSTATSTAPGEDTTQNASPDDTPPAPPTDTVLEMSIELNGEDLSSDGNQVQSELNDSANVVEVEKLDGEDSIEMTDTTCPSTCEQSTSVQVESSTLPSPARLVQPVLQEAEAQTCSPVEPASPGEHTDTQASGQDRPSTTSLTTAEDAQVQTDYSPLPEPPPPLPDITTPTIPSESGKKDMATLTDDLPEPPSPSCLANVPLELEPKPKPLPDITSPTIPSESGKKDMATLTDDLPEPPSPPCPAKVPLELEPRPKPSNELTRDYIPKVGMTTYTIVPQKSLEKLRYFEVALTLESPPTTSSQDELDNGSLQLDKSTNEQKIEPSQKEDSEMSKKDVTTTTTTNQGTVNGSIQESTNVMSSATSTVSQAGSPTDIKEIKIPPATKPKPGSFRLPQHKKTAGYYVTSAAEKSQLSASNQKQGGPERAALPPPPLPPTPVQSPENPAEGATASPTEEAAVKKLTRQSRVQAKEASLGLSLEKLRSFAAPRPYSPSTPSRFAQAVSSAVKRSQSLSSTPQSPRSPSSFSPSFSPTRSPSFSPTRSPSFSPVKRQSPVLEPKEVDKAKVDEHEEHTEEVFTPEPVQHNSSFFSGIIEVEGETNL